MRFSLLVMVLLTACAALNETTGLPVFQPSPLGEDYQAMISANTSGRVGRRTELDAASLWNSGPQSLLGDRRAISSGDILTVVIEIDDKAEISNSTSRKRSGSESLSIPSLLGIPGRINNLLRDGSTLDSAVEVSSTSDATGNGTVRRKEKLTLRVAATIVEVLPNGVLRIEGSQEVRVNFELRELLVSGYIRPKDISRKNEITYDKIASARISYGGRGAISSAQRARGGQRYLDAILPF